MKNRYLRIYSRHPSHNVIRKGNKLSVLYPKLACFRLGSTTPWDRSNLAINSIEAIKNSSDKLLMKPCFDEKGVNSPEYYKTVDEIPEDSYPIIAKRRRGSRGRGIMLFQTKEELVNANLNNSYYFEKYYNYTREYRIHASPLINELVYTNRKMLKRDTPEENKFWRNDSNCVWIKEDNPLFDKPSNWDEIVAESIKALDAVGLDIGAVDVRVRSKKDKTGKHPFKIIEVNSAPSFGEGTALKYKEILPKLLKQKENDIN